MKTLLEEVFTPFLLSKNVFRIVKRLTDTVSAYVLYVSWAFFSTKRHFFLQTINSPCDIFQVFQQVEHESYLLGTKSHLCKKYVFAEAIGVTRHVHRYVHISHYGRIFEFLSKNCEAKMLPLCPY